MMKSEERIRNIKEYILEFQFTYHRTPTMAQIAEAVGTVKSNVYKYLAEMEERGILADLNNKNLVLARLNSKGILRAAEYSEQSNGIRSMVNGLRSERCRLLREQDDDSILCGLRRLHAVFTELTEPVTAFDETVFQEIVQQITVPSHTSICFHLIGGLNLTEKIPEQRRCRRK